MTLLDTFHPPPIIRAMSRYTRKDLIAFFVAPGALLLATLALYLSALKADRELQHTTDRAQQALDEHARLAKELERVTRHVQPLPGHQDTPVPLPPCTPVPTNAP